MSAPRLLVIAGLALSVVAGARASTLQDELSLGTVLERAGAYVTGFQRVLSGVVAEESYTQELHDPAALAPRPMRAWPMHRELRSDLLLVKPQGADRWVQFRDVFEVDGKSVRDRSERLMKLFLEPTASTASQVEQIVSESSRYNIGNIQRTINVPLFALLVLEPTRQRHFTFARVRTLPPPAARDVTLPPGAWAISYEEVAKDTLIKTTNNRDLPSRGRFWIDPSTGRVIVSELVASDVSVSGTVIVSYQSGILAEVLVPVSMHEQYLERRNSMRVEGSATYSKFRQFQVKVDEKIAPLKE